MQKKVNYNEYPNSNRESNYLLPINHILSPKGAIITPITPFAFSQVMPEAMKYFLAANLYLLQSEFIMNVTRFLLPTKIVLSCIMLFITLSGQQCHNQSDMEALYQSWRNLHENDANGIKEYRNNSYDFPLARGRTGFEFKKEGKFIQYDIAPTDGTAAVNGSWNLSEDKKTISIQLLNEAKTAYSLEIVELSQDVLKVKRIEP